MLAKNLTSLVIVGAITSACFAAGDAPQDDAHPKNVTATARDASWKINTPIVTYWAGPPLTDVVARQMVEGGWNLVWSREIRLDRTVANRTGRDWGPG